MNNRRLLIIFGLAVPVVALIILTQSNLLAPKNEVILPATTATPAMTPTPPRTATAPQRRVMPLGEVQKRLRAHLTQLDKMTPAQWAAARKKNSQLPATIEQERAITKARLAQTEAMTPAQWEADQIRKMDAIDRQRAAQQAAGR